MTEAQAFEEYSHFFKVSLDLFDGPIDLLLHLVKQNELPIEKVALAQVATQYLHCIEMMKRYDLEVAGEYLVIAATLLSIKSSVLLNEPVQFVEDEEGNLVDPHEELLKRLRDAEVYKEGATQLGDRPFFGLDVFAPPSLLESFDSPPVEYAPHSAYLLGQAFKKILEKAGEKKELFITMDSVTIVQRMMTVLESLRKAGGPVVFHTLIPDLTSKMSVIGTFVSLLELCKRQAITVEQNETTKEILISLASDNVDVSNLTSEFDAPEDGDDATVAVNE